MTGRETAPKVRVHSPGFMAFVATQFLGAFNDNAFKFAVQMLVVSRILDEAEQGKYISNALLIFTVPFLVFSPLAGAIADRVSKSALVILTKYWEVGAMLLGAAAFATGNFHFLFFVLFLMAMQSTFFSPAKYGYLPEVLEDQELSYANGVIGMTTFLAIILGTVIGGLVLEKSGGMLGRGALAFVGIACAGTVTAHCIAKVPASTRKKGQPLHILHNLAQDYRTIRNIETLRWAVLGLAYFWFMGAIFQTCLILYGKNVLGLTPLHTAYFQAVLSVGIGAGSFLAGKWSGRKVELGLVPLGSIILSVFSVAFFFIPDTLVWSCLLVSMLGIGAGFFCIPLNALLQQKSPVDVKGRIIAFSNLVTFAGVLIAAVVVRVCTRELGLSAKELMAIFGIFTFAATLFILRLIPEFFIRFSLWLLTQLIYRVDVRGRRHVPVRGPALLIANHVSWVDAVIISSTMQRLIRFLMYRPYYEHRRLHWFFRKAHAIPVAGGDPPEKTEQSMQMAADALSHGHMVLIFAEGRITRTGEMNIFKKGFERIMAKVPKDHNIPIIPIHLGGLWGSIFSWEGGKLLWKWPKQLPYHVTVTYGAPMPGASTAEEVRRAVEALSGVD